MCNNSYANFYVLILCNQTAYRCYMFIFLSPIASHCYSLLPLFGERPNTTSAFGAVNTLHKENIILVFHAKFVKECQVLE